MDINIRPVWAEIDLDCIKNNIKEIKKSIPNKEIIAVVKADAYGHGAIDIAPVLLQNGADKLAVAVITEALELRRSGIKCPILVLGYTPVNFANEIIKENLEQTVFSLQYAKELSDFAQKVGKTISIHIKVDTGMGRIGFLTTEESIDEVEIISKLKNIKIRGIFTHFSTADEVDKEYSHLQMTKFNEFIQILKNRGVELECKHISNSAAVLDLPEANYDAVRPGIILYGYYPSGEVNKEKIKLMPALTLKSQVVHVKKVLKGEYISYGRKFITDKESIIATLPIGYADGYTRALFEKAKVIVNGKLAPVVGRICMDQCMIDITEVGTVGVGDEVILLGEKDGVKFDADDIAELLDTINYEIVCMIGRRVPRVYKKSGKITKMRNYL